MTGHPVLRLTLWTGGLIGAIAGLQRLGTGDLGGPPVGAGATALGRWATSRDPASVLMVGVRELALGTAIYLLAATVLTLAAQASRAASLISLSDRITVPLVRRLVGGVLGMAVAAGPLAGAPSAWATRLPPPPSVTFPAGGPAGPAVTDLEVSPPAPAPDPPTLRRLPDNDPTAATAPSLPASALPPVSTTETPTTAEAVTTAPSTGSPTTPAPPATTSSPSPALAPPATTEAPATAAPPATTETPATAAPPGTTEAPATAASPPTAGSPPNTRPTGAPLATNVPPTVAAPGPPSTDIATSAVQAPPATWTVQPGDHLWRIALLSLQAARRRPVSDAEVAPYWLSVVERNRASLPDPANADLLYVGMTVVLPPIP